jgi:hypothetical protein
LKVAPRAMAKARRGAKGKVRVWGRFSTNAYGEDGSVDTIDCHTNTLEIFPRGVFRHEDRVCTLGAPDVRISTLDLDSIQANPCIDVPV